MREILIFGYNRKGGFRHCLQNCLKLIVCKWCFKVGKTLKLERGILTSEGIITRESISTRASPFQEIREPHSMIPVNRYTQPTNFLRILR